MRNPLPPSSPIPVGLSGVKIFLRGFPGFSPSIRASSQTPPQGRIVSAELVPGVIASFVPAPSFFLFCSLLLSGIPYDKGHISHLKLQGSREVCLKIGHLSESWILSDTKNVRLTGALCSQFSWHSVGNISTYLVISCYY